jgi:hypothetical protein
LATPRRKHRLRNNKPNLRLQTLGPNMTNTEAGSSRNRAKWIFGPILALIVAMSAMQPANATFYTYANDIATVENALRTSPDVATITGGRAEITNRFSNQYFVHIQTFRPYPGYTVGGSAAAPASGVAHLSHETLHNYRSQCRWSFADGFDSGTSRLLCRWRTH